MNKEAMDYDKTAIAATYDAARSYRPEVMERWLDLVADYAPARLDVIVDIGCGTGRFTFPLAKRFSAQVIGIDPSQTMLDSARLKSTSGRVRFLQAAAEQLPLEDGTVDLVFMSMMLHHLEDSARAARECRRVLRIGGRLCVRNTTRDCAYPHPRFFPGFQAIVDSQLPSRNEVIARFEGAGLRLCHQQIVPHPLAANWQELADKLALRADSFIVRLPEAEFEAGIAALRAYAARGDAGEEIVQDIQFFMFEA
jgi:ubiquinone/menaquinone biosynthesis C-methylase UbiE